MGPVCANVLCKIKPNEISWSRKRVIDKRPDIIRLRNRVVPAAWSCEIGSLRYRSTHRLLLYSDELQMQGKARDLARPIGDRQQAARL